ncbi:MAG: LytTR family transcriptional regulator [Clostridia bacterium]|nr:LytTR family transcriptional regulator [Clostridia bacterium]
MNENKTIVVKWQHERTCICVDEIRYVESYNRHLIFHTGNATSETVGKLTDILSVLQPHGFVRVHQGYIVNMNHIRKFEADAVVLNDGTRVMTSVRMRSQALKEYDRYIGQVFTVV